MPCGPSGVSWREVTSQLTCRLANQESRLCSALHLGIALEFWKADCLQVFGQGCALAAFLCSPLMCVKEGETRQWVPSTDGHTCTCQPDGRVGLKWATEALKIKRLFLKIGKISVVLKADFNFVTVDLCLTLINGKLGKLYIKEVTLINNFYNALL